MFYSAAPSATERPQPLLDVSHDAQAVQLRNTMCSGGIFIVFGTWQELYDAPSQVAVAYVGALVVHQCPQSLPNEASRLNLAS